jgi:cell division septum initiation protein DivIVA
MSEQTIEELRLENKKLKQENEACKKKIQNYELNSSARAYYVAQSMLNQQAELLKDFDLKTEIKTNPKEDKFYDRAMDLFEKLTSNASKVNNLYTELNLSGSEQKDTAKRVVYTPESMADAIGELAGSKK